MLPKIMLFLVFVTIFCIIPIVYYLHSRYQLKKINKFYQEELARMELLKKEALEEYQFKMDRL